MSDNKQKRPLLEQVQNELREAQLKSVKGQLKELVKKHTEAKLVVAGIEDEIVETLQAAGIGEPTPEEVAAMLAG